VPELFFRNKSDKDILLVDGEELVGAKQNRVLNLSILVAAGKQVNVPVSCVEAGRWAWRSHRFASGKRNLHASARKAKMRGVSAAMRESGQRSRGDIQSEVWRSVDEKMSYFDCRSGTSSLHEVYDSAEERLRPMRATFTPQPRQVGAAFFLNGTLAGLDLFDAEPTLARLLPKLVDSYAFDALEFGGVDQSKSAPSLDNVRRLLARIAAAPGSTYPSVAMGTDVRIDGPDLHAAALVNDKRVVHLSAFDTSLVD